jgi:hypothetical protein
MSVRRNAAIRPQLEHEPTLRGHRECVEFDPEQKSLFSGGADETIEN